MLRTALLITCLVAVLPLAPSQAQSTKNRKENTGDFIDIKAPSLRKADSARLEARLTEGNKDGKDFKLQQDTLVATDTGQLILRGRGFLSGAGQGNASHGGGFPGSENFGNNSDQLIRHSLRSRYVKDTIVVKNLFSTKATVLQSIDLNMPRSLVREDTTDLYDEGQVEEIVEVTEEIQVDSVWLTMTSYFAIWDSRNINPYKFDLNDFKDSVDLTLFDTTHTGTWSSPLATNKLTSNFGMRGWRWHHGVDLDLNIGDPVFASFDGIVRINRSERGGYGKFLVLRHRNGLETLYGHLSKQLVATGEEVQAGQLIGLGGNTGRSTGPHLHYEVRYNGLAFDPKYIYDFDNNRLITNIFTLKPQHFRHLSQQRQTVYMQVKTGDSLGRIARRYQTTVPVLCQLNNMSPRSLLKAGRKLRVK
jgi:murein DD-endopeptidase MepM/ murein hydrolase activator NlpD